MRVPHLLTAVSIDRVNCCRVQCTGRRYRVLEQGASRQAVQHFGQAGFHPLSLACGQNDDVQRGHGEGRWISLRWGDV